MSDSIPSDPALIMGLESRLMNAWPSFDYQFYDGWVLRLAKGYSKRANSASAVMPDAMLDDTLIDTMIRHFLEANVRPTFRLTGLEAPDTHRILDARGFEDIESTFVLTAPIPEDSTLDAEVLIEPKVTRHWVQETAKSYGGDKADDRLLVEIVSRIRQKAAFATLHLDEKPIAWGLGVVERGYLGLYDIVVSPDLRGIGLGRRVVNSLMAWGRAQGVKTVYLQVREANEVARGLYRTLGFEQAYHYTYWVMPTPSSP